MRILHCVSFTHEVGELTHAQCLARVWLSNDALLATEWWNNG